MCRKIFIAILLLIICTTAIAAQPIDRKIRREQRKAARELRREERKSMQGEIQISGAFALYPMVVKWAEEFRKIYPKVKIDISAGGAGKGITDALNQVVDLGMVSREINKAELEKGAFVISVAKDAVVPTVSSRSPLAIEMMTHGLTLAAAQKLWVKGTATTWGEVLNIKSRIPVHVFTRSDACGAAETWAKWLGCTQEDLEGTAVFGDPGVASVIQRDKVGIGFNNIGYAYDLKTKKPHRGIMVIPIDGNGDGRIDLTESFYGTLTALNCAIADGRYPAPPARTLYLICKGLPDKAEVRAFLEFILNEGQNFTAENGYIPLAEDVVLDQLDKLKL